MDLIGLPLRSTHPTAMRLVWYCSQISRVTPDRWPASMTSSSDGSRLNRTLCDCDCDCVGPGLSKTEAGLKQTFPPLRPAFERFA